MAAQGVRRIVLMPYFLYSGQHVIVDIPAILDQCRRAVSGDRIGTAPHAGERSGPGRRRGRAVGAAYRVLRPAARRGGGNRRAKLSDHRPAASRLGAGGCRRPADRPPRRPRNRRYFLRPYDANPPRGRRPRACRAGRGPADRVRRANAPSRFDQGSSPKSSARSISRKRPCWLAGAAAPGPAAAIEILAGRLEGAIVAIGNAPTALWKVIELAAQGGPRPALVVGLPVGFVGAKESKLALLESGLCYITNTNARGGSPVAVAAVHAIIRHE